MAKNIIFLGLILMVVIIFTLQNQEVITVTLLNQPLPLKLPLSWWILLSTGAGMLTSLILQLFNQFSGNSNQGRFSATVKQSNSPEPSPDLDPKPSRTRLQESEPDDEWNIEEPPQIIPERIESEWSARQKEQSNELEEEAPFQPPPRSSALYSYRYRESQKKQPENTTSDQEVYDAEYRVITPPYQDPPSEASEEDEDWI
jgi:uncharacterized integral membrane protein